MNSQTSHPQTPAAPATPHTPLDAVADAPLVSIVTPCFNSAHYLELCIQSVLAQEYPRVEHIVQDGASPDGTREILERYEGRIDWVSEPDKGQADGLNRALQRARGEIILVLNADDELVPGAVSWGVEQLRRHPECAVVYGDQHNIGPDGAILGEYPGPEYDWVKMFCVEQVIPAQAAFVRRRSLEAVGYYADASLRTCPDYEMWVRLGLRFPMRHAAGVVCRYRQHPGSEGCRDDMIAQMVRSKRGVMERVFTGPQTPAELRELRELRGRAHSGAVWWGAIVWLSNRRPRRAWRWMWRSFVMCPSVEQLARWRIFVGCWGHLCAPCDARRLARWRRQVRVVALVIGAAERGLRLVRLCRRDNWGW